MVGQIVIAVQIKIGLIYSLLIIIAENYEKGIHFLLWTLVFIPLLLWTKKNYRMAFIGTLIYYLVSVSLKLVFTNSEYVYAYYAHMIYFVSCMLIGISAKKANPSGLEDLTGLAESPILNNK